ncbi:MAG TPA: aminotransferase class I/II-fold pyridoxal phosphate-dependent enzyme [Vicinamibacterales bacterium]|jgi:aspartate/methionine/tyrosine aminotransferase|nr:aminotransferase class I/II-fold pyridoxal phosphate-dependent enzyme [Vicinamibacterales bacterium]
MKLDVFAMERMQSTYENQVELNLSESGVHPLRLADLVDDEAARAALLDRELRYTQSNGTVPLRSAIAALYDNATPDCVQVTNGGSEANYITTWHLVEPGDEVILMVPNYMQTWGIARGFGATVTEWRLVERGSPSHWTVDTDSLRALVTPRTKLIVICNPNNPTGARFESDDLDRIAAVAESRGIWILSDEIYRGAELDGRETPTMWGRSARVIVTSGLSKAYGLPGLRIGWLVGPPATVASLWSYHDYTTIAPGALSDFLATHALQPARRATLLRRTRSIVNQNIPVIRDWLDSQGGLFTYVPPDAGAIIYVHYHYPVNSTRLVNMLRDRKSVLIVPGDHFGMDGYLRIGYGEQPDYLRRGLNRLRDLLAEEQFTDQAR